MRAGEARERMPEAIGALDQPSTDGVNTYFVSEAAVRAGLKVAVSGVGGDEIFGGYATFQRIPRIQRAYQLLNAVPGTRSLAQVTADALSRARDGRVSSRIAREQ